MMIRFIAQFLLIFAIFPSVQFIGTNPYQREWTHRLRHNRSPHRRSAHTSYFPFPTSTTPVDFQFTAANYNLSVYENSIGQRAIASSPSSAQMVGVWLPRGYHQIQFRIIEGDKNNRFGVSAKKLGNFAFLQLEHKDQMDVLNRELQHQFELVVRATAKRRKGLALEATAKINLEVLDENDNPPMFRELNYQAQIGPSTIGPLNEQLVHLEAFDADEGENGQLYYSLAKPSSHFYIEPRTGWLRTFAQFDPQKMPSNSTLDVRIEDRASRIQFHQKPTTNGGEGELMGQQINAQPMFAIRNRATVEIVVLDENETAKMRRQKPKLHFRQLKFMPISHSPTKVGTIYLAKEEEDFALINLELSRHNSQFIWNCAQIERQNAKEFDLWLCPPFPKDDSEEESTLTIRISVFRISKFGGRRTAFGDQEFQIRVDSTIGQKIWLEGGNDTEENEGPTKIQINETFPPDIVLWQFHANLNHGDKNKIRFKMQRQNGQQSSKLPFELDKSNGQLRLLKMPSIGPNSQKEWNISVVAQIEMGTAQKSLRLQSAPQHFQIILADSNDHCPEFSQIPLGHLVQLEERHLAPKIPSDGIIWKAKATDRDFGENGEIVYKLMGDKYGIFKMNPISGELYLMGIWPSELDQIRLKILAIDRGWPQSQQTQLELIFQRPQQENSTNQIQRKAVDQKMLQSTCQMQNDYAPEFSNPIDSIIGQIDQMAPKGTTIGHISAFDRDQFGPNGIVQYWLLGNNSDHFGLDPINGRLFLRRTLTKLSTENLHKILGEYLDLPIEVMAADFATGQKQKMTKSRFRVKIRGQNVHSPIFSHFAYRIAVREGNQPGQELLKLEAKDADWGQNGQIEFRMALEMDWLSVDPDSGKIRAERALDREDELGEQFTFIVLVLDHGSPSKVSFANVTIILEDINDQSPQCARTIQTFRMPEDGPTGMMVGCIGAFDLDAPNTKNSEIRFELVQSKAANGILPFRVDSETGCIFVEAEEPLDFEQQQKYEFAVKLHDLGSPPLSSQNDCQVEIQLDDIVEGHQPPNFVEIALEASIYENSPPGTDVLRVHAEGGRTQSTDREIRYRLVGGNGFGHFTLNASTGMVSTLKELDHEEHQQFWLTIRAEDGHNPALHSHQHILVRVLNQNDRLPIFTSPLYEAMIDENCEENKIVLKVEATDADEQRFEWGGGGKDRNTAGNWIKYSIVKGDPRQNFAIDEQNGYIVCTKQAFNKQLQSEFELGIRACDQGGLCSNSIAQIGIEEASSNSTLNPRPIFAQPNAQLELSSQMPVGFVLHNAIASIPNESNKIFGGPEISHPQRIQYSLYSADDQAAFDVFRVDSVTGNLIVERELPERMASPFTLVISASLSAQQQNAGFAVLKMRRRPENEHSPMFVQFDASQEQQINLPETILPGDLIYKIEAVDPDEGDFGKIIYTLAPSQVNVGQNEQQKLFSLNSSTGELRMAKQWPTNLAEVFLTIRASDSAPSMPKSTKCHFRILGPKSFRQPIKSTELHFSIEKPSNLSNAKFLGFLNGTTDQILPIGANFILDENNGNEWEECKKLLNIHFATGKLQFNGIFTDLSELNCSISLISTFAEHNLTFWRFFIDFKFLSNEDLNLRMASAEFYGKIQIGSKIGSPVLLSGPSNYSSTNNNSPPIPLKLEVATAPINGANIQFRLLSPMESNFILDQNDGQIHTISTLEFQQNQSSSWEFPVLAQQLANNLGNKKLKYSQPSLVKIALNWPKNGGNQILEEFNGNEEGNDEYLDEQIPTNFLDKNAENRIQFGQQIYNLSLRENQIRRELLLSIWPTNFELGRPIKFTLFGQKSANEWMDAFKMDENAGLLWLDTLDGKVPKLDRERRAQIWLGIGAKFGSSNDMAVCLVQITLEDVNDNAPEFGESELVAFISEAAKPGDRLLQVRVKDPDAGMNGAVRYFLGQDAPQFIELNKNDGKITVSTKIADQKLQIGQQFVLTILAVDRGQPPANSTVQIELRVIHRHQPVFSHQIYSAKIDNVPIQFPHPIQRVRAWSNANGAQIRYRIAQNANDDDTNLSHYFRLDFDRGQLFLLHPLPPNVNSSQFLVLIQALDITRRDAPAGNAQIIVQPKFHQPNKFDFKWPPIFRWKVAEDLPIGSLIGRIELDNSTSMHPISANFTTQIHQNGIDQIQIEPNTGEVRLQSPIDFEQCGRMEFQILAQNGNKSANGLLQLEILNANDNLPEFIENGTLELAVAEEQQQFDGQPLFLHKFLAKDTDVGGKWNSSIGGLQFKIMPNFGNQQFSPNFLQLDPKNGVLTANWSALNEQEKQQLQWPIALNISVNDGLHSAFKLANLFRPQIQSTNFHFQQNIFTAILSAENMGEGTSIGLVKAEGGNEPYKFGITAEIDVNESWPISIGELSGRISLKYSLNKNGPIPWTRLAIPILAIDSTGQKAFAQIQMKFVEENLHSPKWIAPTNREGYQIAVDQWTTEGGDEILRILAVDEDEGDRLEYQIIGNEDAKRLFHLNSSTGILSIPKLNDQIREEMAKLATKIEFSVRVADTGNPPHKSEMPIRIRFLPKLASGPPPFSRVPQFGQLKYSFAVPEDAPVGQFIGQLQIRNENAFAAGRVRFAIINEGQKDNIFALDDGTGKLMIQRQLDAEKQFTHHLLVQICRQDEPQLCSFSLVSISVIDVNDLAPKFLTKPPSEILQIPENLSPGTVIAAFLAMDGDLMSEQNGGGIKYRLEAEDDDADAQIDWTVDEEQGWLQIGPGGLDRERKDEYKLRIVATDGDGKRAIQLIQIRILDINDSPPKFEEKFQKLAIKIDEKMEKNAKLVSFKLVDLDEQKMGKLQIILWQNPFGMFRVEAENGNPSIHNLLMAQFPFPSTAFSPNGIFSTNLTLIAFDGLLSSFGFLQLEMEYPNWVGHHQYLNDELQLDCANQFGHQNIKIAGNLPPGHPIFQPPNSQKIEMFSPGLEDAFQVRNHSELVVLAIPNRQREFTIKMRIYHGENNKNGCLKEGDRFGCIQSLKIAVENANRVAPRFAMPKLTLNISEDAFKFTEDGQMHILTRLEAFDEDWGEFGRIKFEMVHLEDGPFWVDADTGVLALIGPLDREERDQYLLEVIAKDGGGLSAKMPVKINVLDVNDNTPECAQPLYQIQLFENDFNGLDLQLEATDKDQQNNGYAFMFKLNKNVPEKLTNIINVSPHGRIKLAEGMAFDFEEWKTLVKTQIGPSIVIEFGVSISDQDAKHPLTGECRVQLILLDVNDNPPKFDLPLYEAQIKENAPIGTNIIQFSASDIDSQHFGKLSYTLISARITPAVNKSDLKNEEEIELTNYDENEYLEHFSLDDESGWLRTAKPFDFEQIGGNNLIQLRIRAQDGGEPPLNDETTLNIRILDLNDNPPQIMDCTKLTALVQEGIAPGHSLLTFSVQDADSNGNAGPFRLELFGNGADAFAIDPLHNLITTRQLHFAERNEFQLKVQATDVGGLSSQLCPLRIRVQPQSRHPPIVHPFTVQLMALHGEFLGGQLGQIHATDRDPTDLLRFTLTPNGNNQNDYKRFSINPENGELFAQSDLLPGLHRFNVSVTDGKFESQALISVKVIKVDQEALDHSLSIRFRAINAQTFIQLYMRRFMNLLARLVGVQSNNVRILSIQEIGHSNLPNGATILTNNHPSPPPSTLTTSTTIKTSTQPNISQKHGNHQHQQKQQRWRRMQRQHSPQPQHHFIHRERRGQNANSQKMEANLDLLVAVQRADAGDPTAQFHRPAFVKQRLEAGMTQFIQNELPELEMISLTSEVCRRDTCIRGDCRDRLWLDNAQLNAVENGRDGFNFIGPGHLRTFECICRQGYGGPNCDVPVNKCSKELCRRVELCIPTAANAIGLREAGGGTIDEEGIGFNCACPSGFRGPTCSESLCPSSAKNHEECSRQNEAISLLGQGYIELHIAGESTTGNGVNNEFAASLESRMELTLDFRTVSANAVLMHGQGLRDYHTLRIADGHIQYEWDCGSGRGLVQLGQPRVDNGIWHRLRVNRIGRLAKLSIENGRHKAEGTSPSGSDVLNLFGHSTVLIFGARIEPSPILRRQLSEALNETMTKALGGKHFGRNGQLTADELRVGLHEGMIGCIGRIALDGLELPKTQPGIRLFNAVIGCDERSLGPCLGSPCRNGGQCIPGKAHSGEGVDGLTTRGNDQPQTEEATAPFTCQCPARFTGAQCEIDLNACAAHPCPNGIPCHNLYGDFHCSCPAGFTGKTCQLRGDWDPCVTAQCGPNGKCLRQKTTFTCQCHPGWTGPFCLEAVEIGIGMGETDKDDGNEVGNEENAAIGKLLMELLKTHRFHLILLCAICLLIFGLTFTAILLYRHRLKQKRQQQRDRRHLNGANRRLKKSFTNNGTTLSGSFSKETTELPPIVVRGGRRRQKQDGRGNGGNDPASNPLVPRETVAPSQCTADRPPPPLPPRYHRRDLNGTALPTVEVKPMRATNRHNESQQKLNGLKGDEQNDSLKLASQSSQSNNNGNGLLMGSLRPRNGGASKGSTTPVPPPRHSSGELASERGETPEQPLRALGRPLTEEEIRELNLSSSIHSPGARGSATGSYGRKIDQACTAAANTQKQKAKPLRNLPSSIPMADSDESTSDYLTMKPVHRAKPFMANRGNNNKINGRKAGEESGAPPPPLHRTPPTQHHNNGRTSSKLYDNPTDACQEEEDEEGKGNQPK